MDKDDINKEILILNDEVYEIDREYYAKVVRFDGELFLVEDEDA